METSDLIGVVGGALGVFAFFWKFTEALISHVVVELSIQPDAVSSEKVPTARVMIENTGQVPKKISYAALVISPESVSLAAIADVVKASSRKKRRRLLTQPMLEIYRCQPDEVIVDDESEVGLLPLRFLYEEQQQIGNERIQYRHVIPEAFRKPGKVFIVRLVVYSSYFFGFVRWRTTSDLLIG